jgi:hypothetical protein
MGSCLFDGGVVRRMRSLGSCALLQDKPRSKIHYSVTPKILSNLLPSKREIKITELLDQTGPGRYRAANCGRREVLSGWRLSGRIFGF